MRHEILNYLPEYSIILETPDFYSAGDSSNELKTIKMKSVTVQTKDLVNAFMGLQREAIEKAEQERYWEKRMHVIDKIKRMTFFR